MVPRAQLPIVPPRHLLAAHPQTVPHHPQLVLLEQAHPQPGHSKTTSVAAVVLVAAPAVTAVETIVDAFRVVIRIRPASMSVSVRRKYASSMV